MTSPKSGGLGFEFGVLQMFDLSEVGSTVENALRWDTWREKCVFNAILGIPPQQI
jgi:hypothetical protein